MKKIYLKTIVLIALLTVLMTSATDLYAHCEVPCGIYGDSTRFALLKEHIDTMEKSINQIKTLQTETPINFNQLNRWITNKELHADKFGEIVTQYFMRQRIKTSETAGKLGNYDKEYVQKLVLLHEMYVYSMKVKQSLDLSNIETLKMVLKRFESLYMDHH
jgi:nickel superoxide dismutase